MIGGPGCFRILTSKRGCRGTKNDGLEIDPVDFVMVGQGSLSQETSSGCGIDDLRKRGHGLQSGRQDLRYVLVVQCEC